jgi:hypothetical protein
MKSEFPSPVPEIPVKVFLAGFTRLTSADLDGNLFRVFYDFGTLNAPRRCEVNA